MSPELAAEIARILGQRPDLLRSLVRLATGQHVASERRRRKESAPDHSTVDDFYESGVYVDPFESRAERFAPLRRVPILIGCASSGRRRVVFLDEPRLSLRELRKAVREWRGRCADSDVDAAVVYLSAGIEWEEGPRSARLHTVNVLMLPADVRKRLGMLE
jgi:hypothetical protein